MQARNVDEVVSILDGIISGYRDQRSRLAYFPAMYRAVTLRVRDGIQQGRFADNGRMNRLDTAFANRYFAALEAWRAGGVPPRSWRSAFDAAARPTTMILQHLLLGINAHINLDLPIAAAAVVPDGGLAGLEDDFMAVNAILGSLLDPVEETVGQFSPVLGMLDRVGGRSDEWLINFSIVVARDEAWHEATRLGAEESDRRERSVVSLDRRVALLADRILLPGGALGMATELIADGEQQDIPTVVDALLRIE